MLHAYCWLNVLAGYKIFILIFLFFVVGSIEILIIHKFMHVCVCLSERKRATKTRAHSHTVQNVASLPHCCCHFLNWKIILIWHFNTFCYFRPMDMNRWRNSLIHQKKKKKEKKAETFPIYLSLAFDLVRRRAHERYVLNDSDCRCVCASKTIEKRWKCLWFFGFSGSGNAAATKKRYTKTFNHWKAACAILEFSENWRKKNYNQNWRTHNFNCADTHAFTVHMTNFRIGMRYE